MKTLVFLDLDNTLFQTRQKCPTKDALQFPVAYLRDGSAHSFMTAKQRQFWQLLNANATIIPTTARDLDALQRVQLPFHSWSIIDHGGVILNPAGIADVYWHDHMVAASQAAQPDLIELLAVINTEIAQHNLAARAQIVEDFNLPFYVVVKYLNGKIADLDRLQQDAVQPWVIAHATNYQLHRNANNLSVLPRTISKEHAVRYLIKRFSNEWGDLLTIGIGDSVSDGAFMAACDYAITPSDSQLFNATLNHLSL